VQDAARIFLAGASVILPDRIASGLTLVIEGARIVDLITGPREIGAREERVDVSDSVITPGFIDVHVHGALGVDALDGDGSIAAIARALPQWGVTAFCPTTVACSPKALDRVLAEVAALRAAPEAGAARVLPAHLESNFINPDYAGAQPVDCLRALRATSRHTSFSAYEILTVIERRPADVGIVTLAPEIDGGLELVRSLTAAGIRVSLGHSGASFDLAQEAIAAGARHATHLFNRMRPMTHRDPGVAGAVLASDDVAVELIADGWHVHPSMIRVAVAAKGPAQAIAITDATAGAGMPRGARAALGGRPISVGDVATLEDGTLAGSVATMDRVFGCLTGPCGIDVVTAARLCATTPAQQLGLVGHGAIVPGAIADLTILDGSYQPLQTWIGGRLAWARGTSSPAAAS
jgi:N-acetylglucosamine-6-phosphate deacetylase